MSYEAWRITFQDSEQAAKAAYEESQRWERMFTMAINSIVELTEAAGIRKEDQLTGGTIQALNAIDKLKERRDKWKTRALEAEQGIREMVAKAANNKLEGYRELGRKAAAAEEERDALAAHVERAKAAVKQLENDCFAEDIEFPEMFDFLRDEDETPATSQARRDALKLAEFIEQHAENLGACTRNYADKLAHDLHLQANGGGQ
ncbi:hypothetical protein [Halomonas sp. GT]|uniref:hypothetical protein n=1 Tax=Halomonas sp. GT TaxID=1971364 RepID=UPI0009F4B91A|nr:hypothetical protein [Halomonas sp. GT]